MVCNCCVVGPRTKMCNERKQHGQLWITSSALVSDWLIVSVIALVNCVTRGWVHSSGWGCLLSWQWAPVNHSDGARPRWPQPPHCGHCGQWQCALHSPWSRGYHGPIQGNLPVLPVWWVITDEHLVHLCIDLITFLMCLHSCHLHICARVYSCFWGARLWVILLPAEAKYHLPWL